MALIESLQDNFDVDRTASLWPGSFGSYSCVNGRMRIQVDTGYNAIQSNQVYTVNGSFVFFQAFMPSLGGATVQAFMECLIQSGTAGTDLVFNYDAFTGNLTMANRAGYFDAASVTLAYSSTNHRWLRIQVTGGNALWDTSPDGITWTNRKTAAAPAWVTSGTTLYVTIQAHRNDGTVDFTEIDNFNNIPKAALPQVINRAALIRASTR